MKSTTPTVRPIRTHQVSWVPDFKTLLTNIFKPMKTNQHNTFNLENATAQDYFKMIENGELPSFISSKDKERICELYNGGKTWDSVRKLQSIVEGQKSKSGKTLL